MEQLGVVPQYEQPSGEIVALQPDISDHYRDTLIEIDGEFMTISQSMELCPLDLTKISVERKNAYVIPLINEGGGEIDAKHISFFDNHLRENKIDRNYRVKPELGEPKEPIKAADTTEQASITPTLLKPAVANPIKRLESSTAEPIVELVTALPTSPMPRVAMATPEVALPSPQIDKIANDALNVTSEMLQTTEKPSPELPIPQLLSRTAVMTPLPIDHQPFLEKKPELGKTFDSIVKSPPPSAEVIPATLPDIQVIEISLNPPLESESVASLTPPPCIAESIPVRKDEVEAHNYRTLLVVVPALEKFLPAEPMAPLTLYELLISSTDVPYEQPENPTESVPLLASLHDMVIERSLAVETTQVQRVVKLYEEVAQIATLIAEQSFLTANELPETAHITIIERLQAVSIELLESLGLPADEMTIKRFMFTILQEERLRLTIERVFQKVDLTRLGTHEAKTDDWFARFGQMLVRLQRADHNFIGRVALTAWPVRASPPGQLV